MDGWMDGWKKQQSFHSFMHADRQKGQAGTHHFLDVVAGVECEPLGGAPPQELPRVVHAPRHARLGRVHAHLWLLLSYQG